MESKVDKLDLDKLAPVPVKLSDLGKNYVVKKIEYNQLIKKLNDISTNYNNDLVKKTNYNTKINKTENKISTCDGHDKYITPSRI